MTRPEQRFHSQYESDPQMPPNNEFKQKIGDLYWIDAEFDSDWIYFFKFGRQGLEYVPHDQAYEQLAHMFARASHMLFNFPERFKTP
jgi:hypothetical protein